MIIIAASWAALLSLLVQRQTQTGGMLALTVFAGLRAGVSAQALRELAARDVTILHLSYGGWLTAITTPPPHKNIELRRRQFQAAANQKLCLYLARAFVSGKIRNSRTLLRRNGRDLDNVIHRLAEQPSLHCNTVWMWSVFTIVIVGVILIGHHQRFIPHQPYPEAHGHSSFYGLRNRKRGGSVKRNGESEIEGAARSPH